MNDFDKTKEYLDYILKHGDLYDTILKRKNLEVHNYMSSFGRLHLLLLSRILYGGLILVDKVKSLFAPVKKVYNMTREIRRMLGVNIDIVKSKVNTKLDKEIPASFEDLETYLSVLYEINDTDMDSYLANIKKIYDFVCLYNIPCVLLYKADINYLFADVDLSEFNIQSLNEILGNILTEYNDLNLLILTPHELLSLINMLMAIKSDKSFILDLGSKIEDISIRNALDSFCKDNDLEKLRLLVEMRLNLILNSESAYKDKLNGKVFDSIKIEGEYLKVITTNNKGETLKSSVISFYDYLEVTGFQELLKDIDLAKDDKELKAISALYLYLCNNREKHHENKEEKASFYDEVYNSYIEKRKTREHIKGLPYRLIKMVNNYYGMFTPAIFSIIICLFLTLGLISADFIATYLFRTGNLDITKNVVNTIILPYKYFRDIEKNLIEEIVDRAEEVALDFNDFRKSITGDSGLGLDFGSEREKVVGVVTSISEYAYPKPEYFAVGYATSGTYNKGQVEYDITIPEVLFDNFSDVDSLFEVSFDVSKGTLRKQIKDGHLVLLDTLFPIDNNYVLTSIKIVDLKDESKALIIDYDRARYLGNALTEEEVKMLKEMRRPNITYTYGLDYTKENSFVISMNKSGEYSSLSYEVVRKAIAEGLGLDDEAFIYEICDEIRNKYYSLTPISDSGLSHKIKTMNEEEYFRTIASLDSLICNLAATLAIQLDDDLVYVVGYHNSSNYITENEAHAWAMFKNYSIVDLTPSTTLNKEVNNVIKNLLDWGMENKLSTLALITLIAVIIKKLFGKKVYFKIKLKQIDNLVNTSNIEEDYAKVMEVLYGGLNVPIKRSTSEFLDTITKDFAGFTKMELEELRKELQEQKTSLNSRRLVKDIPFIRENEQEIKRILEKKKNKDKY